VRFVALVGVGFGVVVVGVAVGAGLAGLGWGAGVFDGAGIAGF
jgi:hypothetical protein